MFLILSIKVTCLTKNTKLQNYTKILIYIELHKLKIINAKDFIIRSFNFNY